MRGARRPGSFRLPIEARSSSTRQEHHALSVLRGGGLPHRRSSTVALHPRRREARKSPLHYVRARCGPRPAGQSRARRPASSASSRTPLVMPTRMCSPVLARLDGDPAVPRPIRRYAALGGPLGPARCRGQGARASTATCDKVIRVSEATAAGPDHDLSQRELCRRCAEARRGPRDHLGPALHRTPASRCRGGRERFHHSRPAAG